MFYRLFFLLFLGLLCRGLLADSPDEPRAEAIGGHMKYRLLYQGFPANSLLRELLGSDTLDQSAETRVTLRVDRQAWDFEADYQFIAIHSDTLPLAEAAPGVILPAASVITDKRRWWNLTHSTEHGNNATVNRLDRLSIGYVSERIAWRFGRQAISWGNGLIFTPMDVFNPFDPAAVDKEYKTGDDMLYGQFLLASGSDLQGVAIVRRDPATGQVESDQSSLAFKYHGLLGQNAFDLLAAEHYGDQILGIGGNLALGGAVLNSDLTWTDTDLERVWSGVVGLSYSWVWGGRNFSGLLEYYYSGFGQVGGAYAPEDLAGNPDLVERLRRGELFTLARSYLGSSVTVELTPLLLLSPNLFLNLEDPSALAQLVVRYDFMQDLQLVAALNLPIGPDGSEYGGIDSGIPGRYWSTGPSLYAQLAWYF